MKTFKSSLVSAAIIAVICIGVFPPITGCKKDTVRTVTDTVTINDTAYYDAVCPLRGGFSGTSLSHAGVSSTLYYTFQDNNLVVGRTVAEGSDITFGGYKNTCDSVVLSVFLTTASDYYILKGRISNNMSTIAGTFNNLTDPSDYGTFTMSK